MLFSHKNSAHAEIRLSLPYAPKEMSGLIRIDVEILRKSDVTIDRALLRVSFDDPGVSACEKAIGAEVVTGRPFPVVINSHLVRNGVNQITFALHDSKNALLGSQSIALSFSNVGTLARQVIERLRARNTPAVFFDPIDSSFFDYDDDSLMPWFERTTAQAHIDELVANGSATSQEADSLFQFIDEGYAMLPDRMETDLINRVNADLDHAIENRWQSYDYGSSQRLEHLHSAYSSFYQLWTHPRIMLFLNLVFGVPARPCQTLTYVFGSQQDLHQDTVHLTSFPAAYMCGVWVALEDVKNDSGELIIVPGSHRWPRIYMRTADCQRPRGDDWSQFGEKVVGAWKKMVAEHSSRILTYRPEQGTVLVWHENLMHGGSVRHDKSISRRSMVGHYFADGAIVYYDSAGTPGCIL